MGTPQIIYLSLIGINLLASAYLHGRDRETKHNVFTSLLGAALAIGLLYWGGFFN
jgi:hypothetical protein